MSRRSVFFDWHRNIAQKIGVSAPLMLRAGLRREEDLSARFYGTTSQVSLSRYAGSLPTKALKSCPDTCLVANNPFPTIHSQRITSADALGSINFAPAALDPPRASGAECRSFALFVDTTIHRCVGQRSHGSAHALLQRSRSFTRACRQKVQRQKFSAGSGWCLERESARSVRDGV